MSIAEDVPAYKMICTGSKTQAVEVNGSTYYHFVKAFELYESEVIDVPKESEVNTLDFETIITSDFGDKIEVTGSATISGEFKVEELVFPGNLSSVVSVSIKNREISLGGQKLFKELKAGRSPSVHEQKIAGEKYQVASESNAWFTLKDEFCKLEKKEDCPAQQIIVGCSVVEAGSKN